MSLENRAKNIIQDTLYLSLATSFDNDTWIAPLWYATDTQFNMYFVSEIKSKHAQHISKNHNVAVSIFNSMEKPEVVNGLQIEATAEIVGLSEIPIALESIFRKDGADLFKLRFKKWKDPQTYWEMSKFRIYKITPKKIWILDTEVLDTDKRVEVKLI